MKYISQDISFLKDYLKNFTGLYIIESEDRNICESCCTNYYVWCEDVGGYVHEDNAYRTLNGEYYADCYELVWVEDEEGYVHQDGDYYYVYDLDVYYANSDYIEYCEDVGEYCSEYHETEEGVYVYELESCYYCEYDDTYWYHEDNYNSHLEELKEENV